MSAAAASTRTPEGRAGELLERIARSCPELRSAAVVAGDRVVVATDETDWPAPAERLWEAADATGEGADQIHVATESGEVFSVRDGDLVAIAVADRFALASLMLSDLRALLRVLAGGTG